MHSLKFRQQLWSYVVLSALKKRVSSRLHCLEHGSASLMLAQTPFMLNRKGVLVRHAVKKTPSFYQEV